MSEQNFDIVILGGGSGGYAAALRASQLGFSVALVEKGKLGGTCLHVGCIPTKALLHSAEVADVTRESAKYGVTSDFHGIDIAAVTTYRDVDAVVLGGDAVLRRLTRDIRDFGGVQERLGRNAADVGAVPPSLPFFDKCHREAQLARPKSGGVSAAAAARINDKILLPHPANP